MIRMFIILLFLSLNCCSQSGVLGINTSDGLPLNPSLLTWTKVHEERYSQVMDENHVHYTSNFSSSTSNLSALSGSAPSISGGNLVISGSVKYQSTSNPVASWTSAEITIASMGSAGSSNKLGACLIKDATHYIAVAFDKITGMLQLIQDDVLLEEHAHALNTTNLKLFLLIAGNSLSAYYQESGGDVTIAFVTQNSIDLKAIDFTQYKYGIYCVQTGGTTTHNVSSLRGAASGGVGLFNTKIVRNQDGSDYILSGKLLMTADLTNPSQIGSVSYIEANSVLLSIDTATFDVEILGRFYFNRTGKILGGQDLHIIWNGSQWLCHYVPVDGGIGFESGDVYFYLNYADLFTEVIVPEVDLTEIGFTGATYYDVSTRIISGIYKSMGTSATGLIPHLFSGASLNAMSGVSSYSSPNLWESGGWIRYRSQWYLMYSSYGNTNQIVLSYPDMDSVGTMNLPFVTDDRIPGYDWYCKQTNGKTTYYMIGFNTDEYLGFPWAMGKLTVWKATEQKNSYEF